MDKKSFDKKFLRDVALAIIAVFAITVVVYPLLFSPDSKPKAVALPPKIGP